MITCESASLWNGREVQNFHPGDTLPVCSKQGFSRVSDSKMRGKTSVLRNIKLMGVKNRLAVRFLMALHGLKCERGKIILKPWGFLGLEWANMVLQGLFSQHALTHSSALLLYGSKHCFDDHTAYLRAFLLSAKICLFEYESYV